MLISGNTNCMGFSTVFKDTDFKRDVSLINDLDVTSEKKLTKVLSESV